MVIENVVYEQYLTGYFLTGTLSWPDKSISLNIKERHDTLIWSTGVQNSV